VLKGPNDSDSPGLAGVHVHHGIIDIQFSYSPYSPERAKERGGHPLKRLSLPVLLLAFLAVGCAHRSSPVPSDPPSAKAVSGSEQIPPNSPEVSGTPESSPEMAATSGTGSANLEETPGNGEKEETATIPDPLEPFNRAMFVFNDKFYFWVLKPVAQGYKKVVPEAPRVGVKNFFYNLKFPIRFVSSLLQADIRGAAAEVGRFAVNTIWGVGGLLDPASSKQLDIPKYDADLGQTLGIYGLGQGFYVVLPILGPLSARDSIGIAGDYFLNPVSYITPWYDGMAVRTYQTVNDTSLRIGDYEFIKEVAIDPYVALRDAYSQYRQKKVEEGRGKPAPPKPGGVN
jgi:phospholipid-binding lipoprotein MlaA